MTGLDLKTDRMIEIACIATDREAVPLDDGISLVIKTSREVLDAMGEWCTQQHGKTGLTERCLVAEQTMAEVEAEVCTYVTKHFPEGRAILAGSSVHADKAFIRKDVCRSKDGDAR